MKENGVRHLVALLCETAIPLAVFSCGVAYHTPTYLFVALLIFPLFSLFDYLDYQYHARRSSAPPLPFPPLYPFAHIAGVTMTLLAFSPLTLLQKILVVVSLSVGTVGVALAGLYAIKVVNWARRDEVSPPTATTPTFVGLWELLVSLGLVWISAISLFVEEEAVGVAALILAVVTLPHLSAPSKADEAKECGGENDAEGI